MMAPRTRAVIAAERSASRNPALLAPDWMPACAGMTPRGGEYAVIAAAGLLAFHVAYRGFAGTSA